MAPKRKSNNKGSAQGSSAGKATVKKGSGHSTVPFTMSTRSTTRLNPVPEALSGEDGDDEVDDEEYEQEPPESSASRDAKQPAKRKRKRTPYVPKKRAKKTARPAKRKAVDEEPEGPRKKAKVSAEPEYDDDEDSVKSTIYVGGRDPSQSSEDSDDGGNGDNDPPQEEEQGNLQASPQGPGLENPFAAPRQPLASQNPFVTQNYPAHVQERAFDAWAAGGSAYDADPEVFQSAPGGSGSGAGPSGSGPTAGSASGAAVGAGAGPAAGPNPQSNSRAPRDKSKRHRPVREDMLGDDAVCDACAERGLACDVGQKRQLQIADGSNVPSTYNKFYECTNCSEARHQGIVPRVHRCTLMQGGLTMHPNYSVNTPDYDGNAICDHCRPEDNSPAARKKAQRCNVDINLGIGCTACKLGESGRGKQKKGAPRVERPPCQVGGVDMLLREKPPAGIKIWYRTACENCEAIEEPREPRCNWLESISNRQLACQQCVAGQLSCASNHWRGFNLASRQPESWKISLKGDLVVGEECAVSLGPRRTCKTCRAISNPHCRVNSLAPYSSCIRCEQWGIPCMVPRSDGSGAFDEMPIYSFRDVGFGLLVPFSKCQACMANGRNCDRQRPCDSCVATGSVCDVWDKRDNRGKNLVLRGFALEGQADFARPPPLYYLALGYGPGGVNDVKDGSGMSHWIGPAFPIYGFDFAVRDESKKLFALAQRTRNEYTLPGGVPPNWNHQPRHVDFTFKPSEMTVPVIEAMIQRFWGPPDPDLGPRPFEYPMAPPNAWHNWGALIADLQRNEVVHANVPGNWNPFWNWVPPAANAPAANAPAPAPAPAPVDDPIPGGYLDPDNGPHGGAINMPFGPSSFKFIRDCPPFLIDYQKQAEIHDMNMAPERPVFGGLGMQLTSRFPVMTNQFGVEAFPVQGDSCVDCKRVPGDPDSLQLCGAQDVELMCSSKWHNNQSRTPLCGSCIRHHYRRPFEGDPNNENPDERKLSQADILSLRLYLCSSCVLKATQTNSGLVAVATACEVDRLVEDVEVTNQRYADQPLPPMANVERPRPLFACQCFDQLIRARVCSFHRVLTMEAAFFESRRLKHELEANVFGYDWNPDGSMDLPCPCCLNTTGHQRKGARFDKRRAPGTFRAWICLGCAGLVIRKSDAPLIDAYDSDGSITWMGQYGNARYLHLAALPPPDGHSGFVSDPESYDREPGQDEQPDAGQGFEEDMNVGFGDNQEMDPQPGMPAPDMSFGDQLAPGLVFDPEDQQQPGSPQMYPLQTQYRPQHAEAADPENGFFQQGMEALMWAARDEDDDDDMNID